MRYHASRRYGILVVTDYEVPVMSSWCRAIGTDLALVGARAVRELPVPSRHRRRNSHWYVCGEVGTGLALVDAQPVRELFIPSPYEVVRTLVC